MVAKEKKFESYIYDLFYSPKFIEQQPCVGCGEFTHAIVEFTDGDSWYYCESCMKKKLENITW